jgi:hypothetical protein
MTSAATRAAFTDRRKRVVLPLAGQQKREQFWSERRRIGASRAIRLVTLARLTPVDAPYVSRDARLEPVIDFDAQL